MIELKHYELGEKITRPLLDDIKELQEIVQKIRERLPELIEHEKQFDSVGESTDDLRSEITFYKEILE